MSNVELLKQELIKQKEVIESMHGYVNVANNNPSPSEITEGIKTVAGSVDLSLADATEDDVIFGKTFYSGSSYLRTGIYQGSDFYRFYLYGDCSASELMPPNDITEYRQYMFAGSNFDGTFYLGENVEKINKYAFAYATIKDFSFDRNTALKYIATEAFVSAKLPINFSRLPDTLETLDPRPYCNATSTNDGYVRVPKNLTTIGQYALTTQVYTEVPDGIDWNYNTLTTIMNGMFYNQSFVNTFTFPSNITTIKNSSCYNFRCNKVIIPSTVTNMDYNAYCIQNGFASKVPKLDFIFEGTTPPTFSGCPFYLVYKVEDLSIYVPDDSYEEYLANTYLADYVSYIKKMSELPE